MDETIKRVQRREWVSRILMTVDIILIIAGYLTWFQTKYQLTSPLIPRSTVYEVMLDGGDTIIKASLLSAGLFLAGLWLYFFQKRSLANIFFFAVIVCFALMVFIPEITNS